MRNKVWPDTSAPGNPVPPPKLPPASARPADEAAHAALLKKLEDRSDQVRDLAVASLARLGKPVVAAVTLRLESRDTHTRAAAAKTLGLIGPDASDSVPKLLVASVDVAEAVRAAARQALAAVAPDWEKHPAAGEAVPSLVEKLGDSREAVVEAARLALLRLGAIAIPALVAGIEGGPASRREYHHLEVARTLARLGDVAAAAIPAMLSLLASEHTFVRQAALEALQRIGPKSPELVPVLLRFLAHEQAGIRQAACATLGRMGEAAAAAAPELIEALGDVNEAVRDSAATALIGIGPAAVPALERAADDREAAVGRAKRQALKQMPQSALDCFLDELALWDEIVRARILKLLRQLNPDSRPEEVLPLLELCRRRFSPDESLDPEVEQELVRQFRLHTGAERFNQAVMAAVEDIAREVVPSLLILFGGEDDRVRASAIVELSRFGPLAAPALPTLDRLARDPHPRIADLAGRAGQFIRRRL